MDLPIFVIRISLLLFLGAPGVIFNYYLSLCVRKPTIWVPTRSHTNRAVQSQKMVRGWKFSIKKVEELYNPCSENKGADQLRGYREADLRLCFRLCRLLVFPCSGSFHFSWLMTCEHKSQIKQAIRLVKLSYFHFFFFFFFFFFFLDFDSFESC